MARTARYHVLGTSGPGISEVWFVCHGFAQLAGRFLKRFESLESGHRLIVAPEALNRFYIDTSPRPHGPSDVVGATWMTRVDRENEIRDYVRYLDSVRDTVIASLEGVTPRTLVLGFSQGAPTVARWAAFGNTIPDRLVLWGGPAPADLPLESVSSRWRSLTVTHVWGTRDPATRSDAIEAEKNRFNAAGIRSEWIMFDGGHEIDQDTLTQLANNW